MIGPFFSVASMMSNIVGSKRVQKNYQKTYLAVLFK